MTTWIDTNVIVALWNSSIETQNRARTALKSAADEGWFAISGCVYAELIAGPERSRQQVDGFLEATNINVGWQTGEDVWRLAAERFRAYAERRRLGPPVPKRFLADFLIGAQATLRGGRLLTFDRRTYATGFPELQIFGGAEGPVSSS